MSCRLKNSIKCISHRIKLDTLVYVIEDISESELKNNHRSLQRVERQVTWEGSGNRKTSDFSMAILESERKWNNIFEILKDHYL